MTPTEAFNLAVTALGACICTIAWWIGGTLQSLNTKMERVLIKLESHESKIEYLEDRLP